LVPNTNALIINSSPIGMNRRKKRMLSMKLPHHIYVRMKISAPAPIMAAPVTIRATLAPREIETISYLFPDGLNLCIA